MPFSIKRFTMHRSTSMPSGARSDENKKIAQSQEQDQSPPAGVEKGVKKSASQEEHKGKHTSNQVIQPSRSIDSAELKRLSNLKNSNHRSGDIDGDRNGLLTSRSNEVASGRITRDTLRRAQRDTQKKSGSEQGSTLPARWRAAGRSRSVADSRGMYYDENTVENTDGRKFIIRRDGGVRYIGSDCIAEENQSTSSSSGGAPPRGQSSGVRQNEWMETKNGHSNKRSNSRQYHTIAGHFIPMELQNSNMDLENYYSRQRARSPYEIPASVYEDDPGIMSEAETSATGFRRPSKGRFTLPMVRPPVKVQERTLGVVFLQYRKETKRSLLPNELTTLDTIKALFVRSFPKQLTMEYLDSPHVRIYTHDASKNMFYELEDLRDIRDRSVLRIYEQNRNEGDGFSTCDQELSYFSEPEFDSEYQHQHIHRAKQSLQPPAPSGPHGRVSPYPPPSTMMTADVTQAPSLGCYSPAPSEWRKRTQHISGTEPRYEPQGAYSTTPDHPYPTMGQSQYISACERGYESAYDSSPERKPSSISYSASPRRIQHQSSFGGYSASWYEDPSYYRSQVYRPRSRSVTPVIDEETRHVKKRMEFMEHQLASLTGLMQKVLTTPLSRQQSRAEETHDVFKESEEHVGKSVARCTSNTIQLPNSSPEHVAEKPTKSAIKARSGSKAKDERPPGGKPKPPPKPTSLLSTPAELRRYEIPKVHDLSPELCSRLRYLRRQTRDLQAEVRSLRRMAQNQAISARDNVRDTCLKIKEMLAIAQTSGDHMMIERSRITHEEDIYREDVVQVEKDLSDLESQVEELRGNVINKRCRVNMSSVENMAILLSRTSKTVADLKDRFPGLQERIKAIMSSEMEIVMNEEKFITDEPDRLERALRRCKKITGTLVTLKRLASVQEQRHTGAQSMPEKSLSADGSNSNGDAHTAKTVSSDVRNVVEVFPDDHRKAQQKETALDELLNELQSFNQTHEIRPNQPASTHCHSASHNFESVSYGSFNQHFTGHRRSPNPSGDGGNKLSVDESGDRHRPLPLDKTSAPPLPNGRKQQHFHEPPHLPPKKVPLPPPRTSSRSVMQSSSISKLPTDEGSSAPADSTQSTTQQVNKRNPPNLQALRSESDSLRKSTSHDEPRLKASNNQMITTQALTEEIARREHSSSSSSESVNSQEGFLLRNGPAVKSQLERSLSEGDGPSVTDATNLTNTFSPSSTLLSSRNRQEILEHRHQELLNKQKRLQDQYTKLQQLQHAQLLTRFSSLRRALSDIEPRDLKKIGSESNLLSKKNLALASASGSMTHLPTSIRSNIKDIEVLSQMVNKTRRADTLPPSSNKLHETDII
ncbi:coiled-coil domain-containing protein CG32809-like [Limulus polyphemus]|uniref:Coiled-coil domain-containing protein CG32809-like n=1 Tax=Limulus polyphemus TaxID=6850 RepID=A0ABM1S6U5_LIMPO|nr:coiled-coil domain-containing protein CG32809-like [Limulus polyphemus]